MKKPILIVVTGRPGSGKTTLAKKLGESAHMPIVSRDAIKEGYVHTQGLPHDRLPDGNLIATNLFFQTVESLLDGGVSLIAEAAFQHRLWSAKLEVLRDKARIVMLICSTGDDTIAHARYIRRGMEDPTRVYFHGDDGVVQAQAGIAVEPAAYDPPRLAVPTLSVNTAEGYDPPLEKLLAEIFRAD